MGHIIVGPDPAGTIESLSALGYSLEAAIADLVDNSIDAGAGEVNVTFHWAGGESYVAVMDDGSGMNPDQMRDAMALAVRGPRVRRGRQELGRFGMGLKTASFSQCEQLVLWSCTESSPPTVRMWDLRLVVSTGEWRLLTEADKATAAVIAELVSRHAKARTIVLWRTLTKIVAEIATADDGEGQMHFLAAVERVERHLSMTFARYLSGGRGRRRRRLTLRLNNADVKPWDPFMEAHPITRPQPTEHLQVDGKPVIIRPYVLPAKKYLGDDEFREGGGPRGWLDQQGFYVYRNDRLIVAGAWLELASFRKDDKHMLARIAVDIPATLDHLWSIDVKKATARPPIALRGSLTRIAKAARIEAQRTQAALVRTTAQQRSDELTYVWHPEKKDGQLRLRINWQHPLVKESLANSGDARAILRTLLTYMEETVPVGAMRMMFDDESEDYQPFAASPPGAVVDLAQRLFGAYIAQGLTPAQARRRIQHTPPLNEYPDLLAQARLT